MTEPHPFDQFCGDRECRQCFPAGCTCENVDRTLAGCPVHNPQPQRKTTLPLGSEDRKSVPMFSGLLRYFPAALAGVAKVSKFGNDKHNPGQPLHHNRAKSTDHADCIIRHLVDLDERDGVDEHGIPQVAYVAWRALALAQQWFEDNEGAPLAPGAKE